MSSYAIDGRQQALADSGLLRSPGKAAAKGGVGKGFLGGALGAVIGGLGAGAIGSAVSNGAGAVIAFLAVGGAVLGGGLGVLIGGAGGAKHGYSSQKRQNEAISGLVG